MIEFPDGKLIYLEDRQATFAKVTGTGAANTLNIIASTSVNQSIDLVVKDGIIDSKQAGIPSDGATDAKFAIETINAIGSFKLSDGTYRVSSALTLTSRVYMGVGAKIKPDSSIKVTFNNLFISSEDQQGLDVSAGGTFLLNVVTVVVGVDYNTIQEAIDACPKRLHQWYTVYLPSGTYNEDVRVDGIYASYMQPDIASSLEGPRLTLAGQDLIQKDTTVLVDSIIVSGCNAATGHPTITALSVTSSNPYTNEDTAIEFYGSHGGTVSGVSFASCTAARGIQSYNSSLDSNSHDFGINQLDYAYSVKHTGQIYNNTNTLPDTGTLNRAAFRLQSGNIHTYNAYDLISDDLQFVFFSAVGSLIDNASQRTYTASEGQQVRGEFYYAELFTSFTQWTDTSTSGTLTNVGTAARLSAAASNSAEFSLDKSNFNQVFSGADFKLAVSNLTSGIFIGSDCRIVMGSLSGAYIGFRFFLDGANDAIYGIVNDGTNAEQSILVHNATSNGRNNLEVILRNGRVRFYRSGDYVSQIDITGTMGQLNASLIHLKNDSGAVGTSSIDIEFLSVRQ